MLSDLAAALALAWIIAGEAPACPVEAKVAVAQVHANRIEAQIEGGWFGWQEPGPQDIQAALFFQRWPDLVDGALYAIGPGDAAKMPWLQERKGRWECAGGDFVEVWT